jgi:Lon protease-like protein
MAPQDDSTRLPLFPLPNLVHFPGTEVKLHVFEPRYRRLVKDLLGLAPESRLIGMVLIKPGRVTGAGDPDIFPGGTAGLMIDVDPLPDGRSNIVLHGDFRFQVERELDPGPYRQAVVQPVSEPLLNEADPGILAMRRTLAAAIAALADELGERFPVHHGPLAEGPEAQRFDLFVNRIAAEIDLPALTKIGLLNETVPERALHLAGILRNRLELLDLLRPYRHLASDVELN